MQPTQGILVREEEALPVLCLIMLNLLHVGAIFQCKHQPPISPPPIQIDRAWHGAGHGAGYHARPCARDGAEDEARYGIRQPESETERGTQPGTEMVTESGTEPEMKSGTKTDCGT